MKRLTLIASATLLALAACQPPSDPDAADPGELNIEPADIETLPPSEIAAPPIASSEPSVTMIPAAYHGRWGMVPGDCTSTRGDNKGLITIGDKTVKFYESLATLKEQRPAAATSFSGLFHFTGEGQTSDRVMNFTRDREKLTRRESDPDSSFNYTRCA